MGSSLNELLILDICDMLQLPLKRKGQELRGGCINTVKFDVLSVDVPIAVVSSMHRSDMAVVLARSAGNLGIMAAAFRSQSTGNLVREIQLIDCAKFDPAKVLEKHKPKDMKSLALMLSTFMVARFRLKNVDKDGTWEQVFN